jgi:hypothetical protein
LNGRQREARELRELALIYSEQGARASELGGCDHALHISIDVWRIIFACQHVCHPGNLAKRVKLVDWLGLTLSSSQALRRECL